MHAVGNIENYAEPSPLVHLYSMGYKWRIAKDPTYICFQNHQTPFILEIYLQKKKREKRVKDEFNGRKVQD